MANTETQDETKPTRKLDKHVHPGRDPMPKSIRHLQQEDPNVSYPIHQLNTARKTTMGRYKSYGGMKVEKSFLMRQIVILSSMRWTFFEHEHCLHHVGVDKTYQSIHERYFWVGMYSYIQTLCMACTVCQKSKKSYACKETLQAYDTGNTALRATITMDVTTLPWSE